MWKIIQKAILENAGDLFAVGEGYIENDKVRKLEVDFLVDTGAAMICLPIDKIKSLKSKTGA